MHVCSHISIYYPLFIFIWKKDRKKPGVAGHHGYNPGAGKSEQMDLAFSARLESIPCLWLKTTQQSQKYRIKSSMDVGLSWSGRRLEYSAFLLVIHWKGDQEAFYYEKGRVPTPSAGSTDVSKAATWVPLAHSTQRGDLDNSTESTSPLVSTELGSALTGWRLHS